MMRYLLEQCPVFCLNFRKACSIFISLASVSDMRFRQTHLKSTSQYCYSFFYHDLARNGKDGKSYVTQDTPRILDCYEYRSFWIRWVQGVEVGYGWTVGNRPFMAVYQTVSKLVEAIGLSTGDATKGSWRFDEFGGRISLR